MSSIASKSVHGIIWSAIERFSLQGIQFLIGIILARLLSPSDFGMIGMLSIFLSVSQTFIDCGFSNALIRQKETTSKDYDTAFVVNFAISIFAFVILFIAAPYIASFYNMPDLQPITRAVSTTLIINSLFAVHKVKLTKIIDFKTQSKASFGAAFISGGLGIFLAYNGLGVWSLVYQAISNSFLNLFFMIILLKWFPKPIFHKDSFHTLFGFGSKLLIASIISSIYSNIYNIVIGKKFSASNLGYYTRADHLANFPSQNIAGILSRVTYPILSQIQDDTEHLKSIYIKYLQIACFTVFPLMMGLAALAKPLIIIMLGEKWIPSVILLQITCIGLMFDPICNINLNLLYVKGRSDLVLKLEIIKKSIAIAILIFSLQFGLTGLCIGRAIYGIIATILNMTYTKNFIGLSIWGQAKLILPSLILSLAMAVVLYKLTLLNFNIFAQLIFGTTSGFLFYIGFAKIFKMKEFAILINLTKQNLFKRRTKLKD